MVHPQANAAEHVTSVWMAMKNKMELTIGICVGSSIVSSFMSRTWHALTQLLQQIAAFVVPLLVIVGWISGHDLTLFFADFEVHLHASFFRYIGFSPTLHLHRPSYSSCLYSS